MKASEVGLIIYYSLLCSCAIISSNGQANAENIVGNNPESIPNEDTAQFHSESHERRHLLAHLADRMDLDGEGLRHIQKHLGEVTGESKQNQDVNDVAAGNNAKGIFYFFKLHDYDDNQKLDGLEWMQALTDFHQQDDSKGEFKEGGRLFLEHEAEAIIDELLTKHDMDDDGMIDFIELMNSKVNSFMTDLDKEGEVPEGDEQQQQQQNVEQKSSLEQEFNQHQQDQPSIEQSQPQQEDKPQEHQQQQDQQGQQEHQQQQQEHQQQQDQHGQQEHQQQQHQQQQQDNQQQQGQQEHQQQQHQQDNQQQQGQQEQQQQEDQQQEPNSEERQGDQEQQDNQQQNEPSLEDEYKQQQQENQQQQQDNQQQPQGDQQQQDNPQQNEPSLEDEYNQQQQQ